MKLRFAEEFYRIERIGNTETNNLVDPVSIQVVLHDEKHIVYIEGKAIRGSRGRYWVEFDADLLQHTHTYSIFWRFEPIADVVQVKRHDFKWGEQYNNIPEGYCLIYGDTYDAVGMPLGGKSILILQYDDFVVKNRITSSIEEITDLNGRWSFLAKHGEVYQIVLENREKKVFIVPEKKTCHYNDISIFLSENRTDKFGNPLELNTSIPKPNTSFFGVRRLMP
jgi:hypothetical protein